MHGSQYELAWPPGVPGKRGPARPYSCRMTVKWLGHVALAVTTGLGLAACSQADGGLAPSLEVADELLTEALVDAERVSEVEINTLQVAAVLQPTGGEMVARKLHHSVVETPSSDIEVGSRSVSMTSADFPLQEFLDLAHGQECDEGWASAKAMVLSETAVAYALECGEKPTEAEPVYHLGGEPLPEVLSDDMPGALSTLWSEARQITDEAYTLLVQNKAAGSELELDYPHGERAARWKRSFDAEEVLVMPWVREPGTHPFSLAEVTPEQVLAAVEDELQGQWRGLTSVAVRGTAEGGAEVVLEPGARVFPIEG